MDVDDGLEPGQATLAVGGDSGGAVARGSIDLEVFNETFLEKATQVDLRRAVRHLPYPVDAQWRTSGRRASLGVGEMKEVCRRQFAEERMRRAPVPCPRGRDAHAFWVTLSGSELAAVGALTPCCVLGLHTAVHNAKLNVQLWTYHRHFETLPAGVVLRDATEVLPREVFDKMVSRQVKGTDSKWCLPNVSDVVRLLGMVHDGPTHGGWMIDCDTWWLSNPWEDEARHNLRDPLIG
jgi:hypothetical protein